MPKKRLSESLTVKEFRLEHPSLTSYVSASRSSHNGSETLTVSFLHGSGDKLSGVNVLLPVPKELASDERFNDIAIQLMMLYINHSLEDMMLLAADSIIIEAAWFARRKLGCENGSEDDLVKNRMSIYNDVMRRRLRMRKRGNESLWNRNELIEVVRAALNGIKQSSRLTQDNAAKAINKLYKDSLEEKFTGNGLRAMLYRRGIDWKRLKNERKKAILAFAKSN
jgi:hypothetical protein